MPAPLNITKIAFGCENVNELREWLEAHVEVGGEARITTRNLPTRSAELIGGSLYWIHAHVLVGRSTILGFEQREDRKWWIRLKPELVPVEPRPRRAHQGWRYLEGKDAPVDLGDGTAAEEALPGHMASELARLGLL